MRGISWLAEELLASQECLYSMEVLISDFRRVLYVFFWAVPRRLNFISLTRAISLPHTRARPLCGSLRLHYLLCNRTHPYSVTLLTIGAGYFRAKPSPVGYPIYSQIYSFCTYLPMKMEQSVTKCRHIKFWRRGFTQKKIYNTPWSSCTIVVFY